MIPTNVSLIYAMTPNGFIGYDGHLPWPHLKKDMKRFRDLTLHNTVIMGRKTHLSIGKDLPHRENLVLSRNGLSLEDALKRATKEKIFIIGGSEIYSLSRPIVHTIYQTIVCHDFKGDTRFPFEINTKEWSLKDADMTTDENTQITLKFNVWERL